MRPLNTLLLMLSKRAENLDRQHLIESFVDIGPLFALLSNPENQILFGRRGTGKTHVLGYLANEVQKKSIISLQLDMRTVGSTGGIYSDTRLSLAERATRLLVDTLCAVHDKIIEQILERSEECDLSLLGPLLDEYIEASTAVVVQGRVEYEETDSSTLSQTSRVKKSLGASSSDVNASFASEKESQTKTQESGRTKREGVEQLRVHFGSVGKHLNNLVQMLPCRQLWIIMDEWSEIPLDLQPYLADLLRRTVLPIRGVVVKIAAIEQRCRFRIPDSNIGHIGIEVGADAAASINLDEYLVFEHSSEHSKQFFGELLYKHIHAIASVHKEIIISQNHDHFIGDLFTQGLAFEEFVRSAEGVPRDAINIIGIAAQRAIDNKISIPDIRTSARTWYTRAKQQAVNSRPEGQRLLNWIVDAVIRHRQARAFLLGVEIKDDLIDFLYDARVLHIIREGVSAQDLPGRRFNVYSIDYGCYVDLINTTRAPLGLFEVEEDSGRSGYIEVPLTDYRSIRRAILDLKEFYDSGISFD